MYLRERKRRFFFSVAINLCFPWLSLKQENTLAFLNYYLHLTLSEQKRAKRNKLGTLFTMFRDLLLLGLTLAKLKWHFSIFTNIFGRHGLPSSPYCAHSSRDSAAKTIRNSSAAKTIYTALLRKSRQLRRLHFLQFRLCSCACFLS